MLVVLVSFAMAIALMVVTAVILAREPEPRVRNGRLVPQPVLNRRYR